MARLPALPGQINPACSYARKKDAMNNTNTAATVTTAAAISLCVLVTLPPVEKFENPDARPYWQIEIKDQSGRRYSDVYRVKELEKARDLAQRIAADRKLPIVTREPPAPKKAQPAPEPVPMPDPEAGTDFDEATGTPF